MPDRPNILYLLTDQQSAFAMSCMGNADLSTPNMDRLAGEGVCFERAYCTQPLCTPSRASMFTGLMPHECGAPRNGMAIREDLREQELGRLLQASGYECAYGGKWHVPQIAMPEENDHGFRTICGFDDNRLAEACVAYLEERTRERRPFLLVASFDNPHNICEWGRNMPLPWGGIGEPPPVEECPNLPANFIPAAFEPEVIRLEQQAHWGIYPYRERPPEDWRRLRWAYYRLVEKVDREVGKVLDGLEAHGLKDDTVVIFSGDHGDGHGAHQWNQKSALFEEIVRIPFIVRVPGGKAGLRSARLVSNGLDLLPTICDYAGVPWPEDLRGRSLRPAIEGETNVSWREHLVIETLFDGGRGYDTEGRAVILGKHKYVAYDRGRHREQLFDMVRDPGETVNLAVEARHQGLLDDCRCLLAEHAQQTGDRFRVPGHSDGHRWGP
jgi:arylsulfatase A-like enzyme